MRKKEKEKEGENHFLSTASQSIEKAENAIRLSEWDGIRNCEEFPINTIALGACLGNNSLNPGSFQ